MLQQFLCWADAQLPVDEARCAKALAKSNTVELSENPWFSEFVAFNAAEACESMRIKWGIA